MSTEKVLKLLILVFVCVSVINCKFLTRENSKDKAEAILDLVDKIFIQGHRQFDVKVFGKISSSLADVIDKIGQAINGSFATQLYHYEKFYLEDCEFNRSALILVSKNEILNAIIEHSKLTNVMERSLRFVIYCDVMNFKSIFPYQNNFLHMINGHFTNHMYIIFKSFSQIQLLKTTYFTEKLCSKNQLQL